MSDLWNQKVFWKKVSLKYSTKNSKINGVFGFLISYPHNFSLKIKSSLCVRKFSDIPLAECISVFLQFLGVIIGVECILCELEQLKHIFILVRNKLAKI